MQEDNTDNKVWKKRFKVHERRTRSQFNFRNIDCDSHFFSLVVDAMIIFMTDMMMTMMMMMMTRERERIKMMTTKLEKRIHAKTNTRREGKKSGWIKGWKRQVFTLVLKTSWLYCCYNKSRAECHVMQCHDSWKLSDPWRDLQKYK